MCFGCVYCFIMVFTAPIIELLLCSPKMTKTYIILVIAIIAEIIAANALKSSEQFTRLWPTVLSLSCYCVSMFLLTLVLKHMLPQQIKPLWGIELSPDAKPTDHVEYYAERDDAGGAIKQLWTMLFAVPSKTE